MPGASAVFIVINAGKQQREREEAERKRKEEKVSTFVMPVTEAQATTKVLDPHNETEDIMKQLYHDYVIITILLVIFLYIALKLASWIPKIKTSWKKKKH